MLCTYCFYFLYYLSLRKLLNIRMRCNGSVPKDKSFLVMNSLKRRKFSGKLRLVIVRVVIVRVVPRLKTRHEAVGSISAQNADAVLDVRVHLYRLGERTVVLGAHRLASGDHVLVQIFGNFSDFDDVFHR